MGGTIQPLIVSAAHAAGIDPAWLAAINQQESGGKYFVTSPAGAEGTMQMLPATAAGVGVTDPYDPTQAIPGAAKILAQNLKAANGNPALATAMYFGGPDHAKWGPKTVQYVNDVAKKWQEQKQAMANQPQTGAVTLNDLQASAGLSGDAPAASPAPSGAPSQVQPISLDDLHASAQVPALPATQQMPSMSPAARAAHPIAARILDASNDIVYNPVSQGIMRGFHAVTDLPAQGAAMLLGGPGAAQQEAATDQQTARQFQQNYGNNLIARGANLAEQGALALPLLESGVGAVRAAGEKVLPGLGNLLTGAGGSGVIGRGASMAAGGALTGAGAAALTAGGSSQPIGQQIEEGAEGGAVAGPVLGAAGALAGKALGGFGVDPYVAKLAQAAQARGIPLRAGQIATNPFVRMADDAVARVPFSGSAGMAAQAQSAFNRNVAATMGTSAEKLTPDVMQATKARLGQVFDSVAQQTPRIDLNPILGTFSTIENDARSTLTDSEFMPVAKQMSNVLDMADSGGGITGTQYQSLTRKGAPLDRAMQSNDPNVRFYAGQVRDALDQAMQASAPPEAQKALATARAQYKSMKTIEPLAAKSTTGDISPAALMQRVLAKNPDAAYNGGGDMGELARIGQQFMKAPPNSGTPERLAILTGLGMGGGGTLAGQFLSGNPLLAAAGTVAPIVTARAANALLNNNAVREAMIRQALGESRGAAVNALTAAAAQPVGATLRSNP